MSESGEARVTVGGRDHRPPDRPVINKLPWLAFGIGAAWMLLWGIWGASPRTPWTPMVFMGVAALVSWVPLKQAASPGRIASAAGLTLLATTAWLAVCVLMAFPEFTAPRDLPSFVTSDQNGDPVDETALDRPTLIVFFRGKW